MNMPIVESGGKVVQKGDPFWMIGWENSQCLPAVPNAIIEVVLRTGLIVSSAECDGNVA